MLLDGVHRLRCIAKDPATYADEFGKEYPSQFKGKFLRPAPFNTTGIHGSTRDAKGINKFPPHWTVNDAEIFPEADLPPFVSRTTFKKNFGSQDPMSFDPTQKDPMPSIKKFCCARGCQRAVATSLDFTNIDVKLQRVWPPYQAVHINPAFCCTRHAAGMEDQSPNLYEIVSVTEA